MVDHNNLEFSQFQVFQNTSIITHPISANQKHPHSGGEEAGTYPRYESVPVLWITEGLV